MSRYRPTNLARLSAYALSVSRSIIDHLQKGVGIALLKKSLSCLETQPDRLGYQLERVLLIMHEDLHGLYEKAFSE